MNSLFTRESTPLPPDLISSPPTPEPPPGPPEPPIPPPAGAGGGPGCGSGGLVGGSSVGGELIKTL